MAAGPGRPSLYSAEIAQEICERRARGESLNAICKDDHMPDESTVRAWDVDNRQGFSPKYARAVAIDMEREADRILEIADEAPADKVEAAWQKTRIDARKWVLSKRLPRKFGDQIPEMGAPDEAKTYRAIVAALLGRRPAAARPPSAEPDVAPE